MRREQPVKPRGRRTLFVGATVVLAAGILAAVILLRGGEPRGAGSPLASPAAPAAPISPVAGTGFQALNGRWRRPDGGYILEIRAVDTGGKIDAVYLNPQPINVVRAEVTRDGSALKLFVELRGAGYPGSTYTLTYDPKGDQLAGVYFQAVLRQSLDVTFVRMK
jgi:hypothetical protein